MLSLFAAVAGSCFSRLNPSPPLSRKGKGVSFEVAISDKKFENWFKEGEEQTELDGTSYGRFVANQAGMLMRVLAYNLLHMLRLFYIVG